MNEKSSEKPNGRSLAHYPWYFYMGIPALTVFLALLLTMPFWWNSPPEYWASALTMTISSGLLVIWAVVELGVDWAAAVSDEGWMGD